MKLQLYTKTYNDDGTTQNLLLVMTPSNEDLVVQIELTPDGHATKPEYPLDEVAQLSPFGIESEIFSRVENAKEYARLKDSGEDYQSDFTYEEMLDIYVFVEVAVSQGDGSNTFEIDDNYRPPVDEDETDEDESGSDNE